MNPISSEFDVRVRTRGPFDARLRVVEIRYPTAREADEAMGRLLAQLIEGDVAQREDADTDMSGNSQ